MEGSLCCPWQGDYVHLLVCIDLAVTPDAPVISSSGGFNAVVSRALYDARGTVLMSTGWCALISQSLLMLRLSLPVGDLTRLCQELLIVRSVGLSVRVSPRLFRQVAMMFWPFLPFGNSGRLCHGRLCVSVIYAARVPHDPQF